MFVATFATQSTDELNAFSLAEAKTEWSQSVLLTDTRRPGEDPAAAVDL